MRSAGKRVVVLDQKEPLRYQAIQPAEMEAAANEGRIAFIEDTTHPAVRGLRHEDFFTWSPGEVVYRNAYSQADRGTPARSSSATTGSRTAAWSRSPWARA